MAILNKRHFGEFKRIKNEVFTYAKFTNVNLKIN
jgi:hypothetical protein